MTTFVVKAPLVADVGVKGLLAMVILIVSAGIVGWLPSSSSLSSKSPFASCGS